VVGGKLVATVHIGHGALVKVSQGGDLVATTIQVAIDMVAAHAAAADNAHTIFSTHHETPVSFGLRNSVRFQEIETAFSV
jgi:hypothetical protein